MGTLSILSGGATGGSSSSGSTGSTVSVGVESPSEAQERATAVFDAHSRVKSSGSSFYVLGLVQNTSSFVIDKPKVTAVMKSAKGAEVGNAFGFADCTVLEAGASCPIKILVNNPPEHAKLEYEVTPRRASYIPKRVENLNVEVLGPPKRQYGSFWEANGKVHHQGKEPARFVHVRAVALDDKGKIVGLESTYADAEVLAPGASARFRVSVMSDVNPARFEFNVEAQPAP